MDDRDTLPPSSPVSSPHADEFAIFGDIVRQVVREEITPMERRLRALERSQFWLPLAISFVALGVSLANTLAIAGGFWR